FLAVVVEGDDEEVLRPAPADVNVPVIDGRGGRGEAVVLVLAVLLPPEFARPGFPAVGGIQAEDKPLAGALLGGREEDALTPEDRRRVPAAGQLHLPVDVLLGPARRHPGLAEAGAVRPAEARPFLGDGSVGEPEQTAEKDSRAAKHRQTSFQPRRVTP